MALPTDQQLEQHENDVRREAEERYAPAKDYDFTELEILANQLEQSAKERYQADLEIIRVIRRIINQDTF